MLQAKSTISFSYYRQSAGYIIGNRQLIRQGNKVNLFPGCYETCSLSKTDTL